VFEVRECIYGILIYIILGSSVTKLSNLTAVNLQIIWLIHGYMCYDLHVGLIMQHYKALTTEMTLHIFFKYLDVQDIKSCFGTLCC
jgi:hypothetical protein